MLKHTLFIQADNAGWSESFYKDKDLFSIFPDGRILAAHRLALLGNGVRITAQRAVEVGGTRLSRLQALDLVRTGGITEDSPFQSLVCRFGTLNGARRTMLLRGIPDAVITSGQFTAATGYNTLLGTYFTRLRDDGWLVRIINRSNPIVRVRSVDGAGVVVTETVPGIAENAFVQFYRARDTTGLAIKGQFQVGAVTDERHFVLPSWAPGRIFLTGKMRLVTYQYERITIAEHTGQIRSHKVGRPFGLFRGRAPART